MKQIPILKDVVQKYGKTITDVPEIRVWCHPHRIGKDGDDYYYVFDSFRDALEFIKKHKEAEEVPLIAFMGYEINIFDMKGEVIWMVKQPHWGDFGLLECVVDATYEVNGLITDDLGGFKEMLVVHG
jgi:hypothetical protein